MQKYIYLLLGWGCTAMGMIGIIVPGLPTTPFLLLALYCFARSSPRLHDWLLNHKQFGPILREWQENRTIPKRAKFTGLAMIGASAVFMAIFLPSGTMKGILLGLLIVPVIILLRLKSDN